MSDTAEQATIRRVLDARAALGPVGVSLPTLGPTEIFPMPQQIEGVRRLEKAGYRAAWAREGVGGHDSLVEIATMLGATTDLVMGSGVANMWVRPPQTLHAAGAVLGEAYPGRYVMGLGAGMAFHAEALGQRYERPLSRMREYLQAMTTAGPALPVAPQSFARILAGNGPKMVELAAASTDGVHPGLIPASYTAAVRQQIGPDRLLVVGLSVVAMPDLAAAREAARQFTVGVLNFPGSPYGANLLRLGYGREELAEGTDVVVDALIAHGGPDEIAAAIRRHLDAGADHVLINSAVPGYDKGIDDLEWLAPTLTTIEA